MNFYVVVLAVGLMIAGSASAHPGNESPAVPEGHCECAAFRSAYAFTADVTADPAAASGDSESPDGDRTPLVSQSPGVKVACDAEGASSCRKLCLALARAAGARGPELLCDAVAHVDSVKVAIFTRICDEQWRYTGVTARDPICCHDNKPLMCPGQTSYPSEPEGCDQDEPTAACDATD